MEEKRIELVYDKDLGDEDIGEYAKLNPGARFPMVCSLPLQ
jgi:hypothetical protein